MKSASTTTARSSASTSSTRRAAASRPICPARSPTARCSTATTPISIRRCDAQSAPLYTNTVSNTAFRGFGGPQGMVGAERVIDEVAFAARQGSARNPQAQFLRHRATATSRRTTRRSRTTSSSASSPNWRQRSTMQRRRRDDPGLQRQQPLHQARAGADAGQVRHLLHRHPLQPGRRAGACLHRRLGPSEPWRHRDGAGPLRQGRAGGGGRVPDRPRPGEDHRDDDRQGAEHLGHRGVVRLRPQRHGGAERAPGRSRTG